MLVVLAAAGFGILGPLARFGSELGFSAASFATWRAISSAIAMLVMLAIGLRIGRAAAVSWSSMSRLEHIQLGVMGVFVIGTTLGLFSAFEHVTIAVALTVFYAYPIIVALIAARLYGEPLGPLRIAAILLATAGMVLVVITPTLEGDGLGLSLLGVAFALVAAGSQAGYALIASRGYASVPALQAGTYVRGFALVLYLAVVTPLLVVAGNGADLIDPLGSIEAWMLILVIGIVGAALPTAMLLAGYRRVGPTRGAVLMLFEPVVGVLLAALLLAERPSTPQLIGGLLVLTGAALVQLAPTRQAEPASTAEEA
jgi:DME family drug/metabolite transporter